MKQDSTAVKEAAAGWERKTDTTLPRASRSEARQAFQSVQDELAAARRAGDRGGESAAMLHMMRGDYWSAMAASLDAFHAAEAVHDRLAMARAVGTLVAALTPTDPGEDGLVMLEAALAVALEQGDGALEVRARNVAAIVQGDLGRFDAAEANLQAVLAAAREGREGVGESRILANLANLQRKRAEAARDAGDDAVRDQWVARGLALAGEAESRGEAEGKLPVRLDAINVAGMLHAAAGDANAALARFETSWPLAIAYRHCAMLPFLGSRLGALHLARGHFAEAESILLAAHEEARLYRPSAKGEALCKLLADVRRQRGDPRGEHFWMMESKRASFDFHNLRREAQRQLLDIGRRWLG